MVMGGGEAELGGAAREAGRASGSRTPSRAGRPRPPHPPGRPRGGRALARCSTHMAAAVSKSRSTQVTPVGHGGDADQHAGQAELAQDADALVVAARRPSARTRRPARCAPPAACPSGPSSPVSSSTSCRWPRALVTTEQDHLHRQPQLRPQRMHQREHARPPAGERPRTGVRVIAERLDRVLHPPPRVVGDRALAAEHVVRPCSARPARGGRHRPA